MAMLHAQLAPSAQPEQLMRIQQTLARVFPYWVAPMAGVLAREMVHLPLGSTVVYVGAARTLDDEGIALLEQMRRRGHAVTTLLTGAEAVDAGRIPVVRLGDANTWRELLTEALAAHGINTRGHPLPIEQEGDGAGNSSSIGAGGASMIGAPNMRHTEPPAPVHADHRSREQMQQMQRIQERTGIALVLLAAIILEALPVTVWLLFVASANGASDAPALPFWWLFIVVLGAWGVAAALRRTPAEGRRGTVISTGLKIAVALGWVLTFHAIVAPLPTGVFRDRHRSAAHYGCQ